MKIAITLLSGLFILSCGSKKNAENTTADASSESSTQTEETVNSNESSTSDETEEVVESSTVEESTAVEQNQDEKPKPDKYTPLTKDVVKVTAKIGKMDAKSDPITIDSAYMRGNILYLDVTYSGGCEDHRFEVIGNKMVMKSMPPIRSVKLIHDNMGDSCREMKSVKLEINAEELAYKKEKGSKINLQVQGWRDKLLFEYVNY